MVGVGYADVWGGVGGNICDDVVVYLAIVGIEPKVHADIRVQRLKVCYGLLVYLGLGLVGVVLCPEGYLLIPVCVEFLRLREFPEPPGAVAAGKERKQHTQRQYEADKLFIHTNPLYLLWMRRPLSCCGISETAL